MGGSIEARNGWRRRLDALVARFRQRADASAEARFRRMVETSLQGIVIHDGRVR